MNEAAEARLGFAALPRPPLQPRPEKTGRSGQQWGRCQCQQRQSPVEAPGRETDSGHREELLGRGDEQSVGQRSTRTSYPTTTDRATRPRYGVRERATKAVGAEQTDPRPGRRPSAGLRLSMPSSVPCPVPCSAAPGQSCPGRLPRSARPRSAPSGVRPEATAAGRVRRPPRTHHPRAVSAARAEVPLRRSPRSSRRRSEPGSATAGRCTAIVAEIFWAWRYLLSTGGVGWANRVPGFTDGAALPALPQGSETACPSFFA